MAATFWQIAFFLLAAIGAYFYFKKVSENKDLAVKVEKQQGELELLRNVQFWYSGIEMHLSNLEEEYRCREEQMKKAYDDDVRELLTEIRVLDRQNDKLRGKKQR